MLTLMTPSTTKRWSNAILFTGILLLSGCRRMLRMYENWNASGYRIEHICFRVRIFSNFVFWAELPLPVLRENVVLFRD